MIFTSKNASAYNTVFTTHVKIAICQFQYFTPMSKEFQFSLLPKNLTFPIYG